MENRVWGGVGGGVMSQRGALDNFIYETVKPASLERRAAVTAAERC